MIWVVQNRTSGHRFGCCTQQGAFEFHMNFFGHSLWLELDEERPCAKLQGFKGTFPDGSAGISHWMARLCFCKVLFLEFSCVAPDSLGISWRGRTSLSSQIYNQHAVLCYGIFLIYSVILFWRLINKYQDPWFVREEGPLNSSPLNSQRRLCTLRSGRVFGQPLKMTSCPRTANRWALVSRLPLFLAILTRVCLNIYDALKSPGWSSFSGKKWPYMWVPIFRHTHTWEDDRFHVEALVEVPNQLSFVDQQLYGPYWVVKEGL